jgi:hypothetical protein
MLAWLTLEVMFGAIAELDEYGCRALKAKLAEKAK